MKPPFSHSVQVILSALVLSFSVGAYALDDAHRVSSVWQKAWSSGIPGDVFEPTACDRGQILDLKDTAESDALDSCQEKGLRHCRILGSTVLANGYLSAELEFQYGFSTCNPRTDHMACAGFPNVTLKGCMVKATAAGDVVQSNKEGAVK